MYFTTNWWIFYNWKTREKEQRKMSIYLADSFCTTNMTFLVYHPIAFDSREIIVSSFCMRQASPLIFSSETLLVEARISDIRAFGRGETVLRVWLWYPPSEKNWGGAMMYSPPYISTHMHIVCMISAMYIFPISTEKLGVFAQKLKSCF